MFTKTDLHEYQTYVVNHVLNNPYCGEFLDMGLGKTVCTLTALDILLYEEVEINAVLVVAPKRVVESVWLNEQQKWAHLRRLKIINIVGTPIQRKAAAMAKSDIYVISRDNLAWLVEEGLYTKFDMLVLDELSSFKSIKSLRFKAAKKIRPLMKRVIGLTGTPAPNGLLDLWPQVFLLDRGVRLERTLTNYRNTYFDIEIKPNQQFPIYTLKNGASKIIHDKISDICISMAANDYIKMPESITNEIRIPLTPELKKQYKDFEKSKILELFESDTEVTAVNAGVLSNKLIQFSNGAVYTDDRQVVEIHDLKIKALEEIIEDSNGQSILVSYLYQHDVARLKVALAQYKPRELKTADDINDWNAGKIQVALVHPASVGHGLNLQSGGHIIAWFGIPWSLELFMQLRSRLLRQGQKATTVISHFLLMEGTHDIDVLNAITHKQTTQTSLLSAIKARIKQYQQLKIDFQ